MRRPETRFAARLSALVLAIVLCCAEAAPTFAQDSVPNARPQHAAGPVAAHCIALLLLDATPAAVEWSPYVSVGGGFVIDDRSSVLGQLSLGFGAEMTVPLVELSQRQRYGGAVLSRWGSWVAVHGAFDQLSGEGGLLVSLSQAEHAPFGTYTLRGGFGYGDVLGEFSPYVTATLTGGVHSFLGRYSERGACDPDPIPQRLGFGSVVRLFATWRQTLHQPDSQEWIFGLEITPSIVLPPNSWMKWAGGRP